MKIEDLRAKLENDLRAEREKLRIAEINVHRLTGALMALQVLESEPDDEPQPPAETPQG